VRHQPEHDQLIVFRALQGLGGGGLLVVTIAAVGDIIAPRHRGRYQGYFGAVFGVATVVGPLLGGFFVDSLSWRWSFSLNLPIGLVALGVLATVFQGARRPQQPPDRLPRCGAVGWWPVRHRAVHDPRRHHLSPGARHK
jgi:MFS family permease